MPSTKFARRNAKRRPAWRILDAQYFGVAQRRKRVFVVASARNDFDPAEVLFESQSVRRNSAPCRQPVEDVSNAAAPGTGDAGRRARPEDPSEARESLVTCFGGGNTRDSIDLAACLTARGHKCDFSVETFAAQTLTGSVTHTLNTANNGKNSSEDGTGRGTPIVAVSYRFQGNEFPGGFAPPAVAFAQNSRSEVRLEGGHGQIVGTLSTGGGKPGQGLPTVASVALRGRQHGATAELGGDLCAALRASSGSSDKEHVLAPSLEVHFQLTRALSIDGHAPDWTEWRVRRLMPLECERLQGLPDDYTLVPYRGGPAADGPRYAAIGNSMAVPCMTWIGQRLIQALRLS